MIPVFNIKIWYVYSPDAEFHPQDALAGKRQSFPKWGSVSHRRRNHAQARGRNSYPIPIPVPQLPSSPSRMPLFAPFIKGLPLFVILGNSAVTTLSNRSSPEFPPSKSFIRYWGKLRMLIGAYGLADIYTHLTWWIFHLFPGSKNPESSIRSNIQYPL